MITQSADSQDSQNQEFSLESIPERAEAEIIKAVRSIQYGSVEVIIHDARIVQIECKKKIRMPARIIGAVPKR
jgi:hypothetical protein